MQESKPNMEQLRVRHEAALMAIPGVQGIGEGICKSGNKCLKIYTSVPPEEIRVQLPEELRKIEVEIEYVGEIKAQ